MLARRCDEGFEVSIQDEGDRKYVLNFVKFQSVVTLFWILDALSGMLTALWKVIVETVLKTERVHAVRANERLLLVACSVA